MRTFARVSLLVLVGLLAAGPALALPSASVSRPTLSGPTPPAFAGLRLVGYLAGSLAVFGAIRIKDTGSLAKKFVQRASAAAGDYKDGVMGAGADWEANARAGADNFANGVQQAIADKRFEKGIAEAGAAKFTARASTLGAQRYPTGVGAAEGDWSKGTQPYLQTLASLTLPPRRPKGDPGNFARSNAVAVALRAQKVGR